MFRRPEPLHPLVGIGDRQVDRGLLRATLDELDPVDVDPWLDRALGLESLPDDGPELPTGCVPYLPCPARLVMRALDEAAVDEDDVFVDVGSGIGRVIALAHLLTGASAIGLEIQSQLVDVAMDLAARLGTPRLKTVKGDAAELVPLMTTGTVFFLYCPFSGSRLERILDDLETVASTRPIRVCCVHVAQISRPWLRRDESSNLELSIYRSRHRAV